MLQQFFQDGARIEAAFRKFFYRADVDQKEDSYEIFVGHSNVIRYFVCRYCTAMRDVSHCIYVVLCCLELCSYLLRAGYELV